MENIERQLQGLIARPCQTPDIAAFLRTSADYFGLPTPRSARDQQSD